MTTTDSTDRVARPSYTVGDIDVDVEYDLERPRILLEYQRRTNGQNPQGDLMRELFRGQRIFQPHFRQRESLSTDIGGLTLLWRRGETLDQALGRLHRLKLDPAAGRAARDPVVPELEGLERWIPRPLRRQLSEWVRAGRISLGRIELEDGRPRGRVARESIEDRWGATNPMRRAASAAAAYLEQLGVRGINAYGTWAALQGDQGCVLVGLTIGHFFDAMTQLEHGDLESWLQVLHPTRRAPLLALSIRPWGAWSDDADR